MAFSSIPDLLEELRHGRMIILMDDEDRENEGDLLMAASHVKPEDINFMAQYGRGLICLTLEKSRCEQLDLELMVNRNSARFSTAFTTSIEAAEGVTTGISAADRAKTIQAAVAENAIPSDLVQPGHIFPLMAQPGGVLSRAGHTEAGCDMARMAGLKPAAVIVEILNEDGTMARRPDLEQFAKRHQLKMGNIADLIKYRALNEKTVQQVAHCHWPTGYGDFELYAFQDGIDDCLHYALVKGDLNPEEPTLVRVHVTDRFADLMAQKRGQVASWSLDHAIQYISQQKSGVIVILDKQESTQGMLARMQQFAAEDQGAQPQHYRTDGLRRIGIGSQILVELGVHKIRLLSPKKKYYALSGFNLEIVDYIEDSEW